MKTYLTYCKTLFSAIPHTAFIAVVILLISCEESGYEIEYQDGYPNKLAGNWVAFDYQLTKENYMMAIDTINYFDLTFDTQFSMFIDLLEITGESDEYDLVTALDPYFQNSIIFNNIYNSGIRTQIDYQDNLFEGRYKDQLEVINKGGYDITFVSLSGQMMEDPDGDMIFMVVGLYDKEQALLESLLIAAYRKTGFEDTEYRSLLSK